MQMSGVDRNKEPSASTGGTSTTTSSSSSKQGLELRSQALATTAGQHKHQQQQ
jgi:hypothetical protein